MHAQGHAHINSGVAFVQIPRNASQAFREHLGGGWRVCCIHEENPKYIFAVVRDPLERYLSGWSECSRRYGPLPPKIEAPFCRDDHTTLQSWFLRGIKPDRCILINDLEKGLAAVSKECGIEIAVPKHSHGSTSKPQIPTGETLISLMDYLREDLRLYGYWQAINKKQ